MVKKMKVMFLSCLTIMLCISAIAVGTYALFSQEVKITNHLQAAELGFTLERTNLVSTVGDGKTDDSVVDFTAANSENIFGLEDGDLIVPTDTIKVTMKLTYTGNIDFGYYVYLDLPEDIESTWGNQLKVSLEDESGNALVGGTKEEPIEVEYTGSDMTVTFNVVLQFLDDENNNDTMGKEAEFDLIVGAVQLPKSQANTGTN